MKKLTYSMKIGKLIQNSRIAKKLTQSELAKKLNTSQSAVGRIEKGGQNISVELLGRISQALSTEIIVLNENNKTSYQINGGKELSGTIETRTSKNASVALLCASLINHGTTTLKSIPKIEEVNRLIEVLTSIGVKVKWVNNSDLAITPPKVLDLDNIDKKAAKRTRSIIMFLGPLLNQYKDFKLPFAGGCNLGERTVEPHLNGLKEFGLNVEVLPKADYYHAKTKKKTPENAIVLTERGDTVTENILMAASLNESEVVIRNASPNYMVQDLCFFLQKLGIKIEGIGTTTLKIKGKKIINKNIEYFPAEDPIESMSFIAAALVTNSEITIKRAPIEFLEIELSILYSMGLKFEKSKEYFAKNNSTRLVDLKIYKSKLKSPKDKLHSMPFPGVNMDNLPLLGLIAAVAHGRTLIHDWSYENRAIYFTELSKLNANVELVDPHRVYITGPTKWKPADIIAPSALRPAVVILLAMLAAPGTSTLRDIYSIKRGYEDFASRLNSLGAEINVLPNT